MITFLRAHKRLTVIIFSPQPLLAAQSFIERDRLQLVHNPGARLHHAVTMPEQLPQIPVLRDIRTTFKRHVVAAVIVALSLCSASLRAQFATVQAQLADGQGNTSPQACLHFELYNCGSAREFGAKGGAE